MLNILWKINLGDVGSWQAVKRPFYSLCEPCIGVAEMSALVPFKDMAGYICIAANDLILPPCAVAYGSHDTVTCSFLTVAETEIDRAAFRSRVAFCVFYPVRVFSSWNLFRNLSIIYHSTAVYPAPVSRASLRYIAQFLHRIAENTIRCRCAVQSRV